MPAVSGARLDPAGQLAVMQLGVIGAVPLVAFLALATRRLQLALDAVLAAGSSAPDSGPAGPAARRSGP